MMCNVQGCVIITRRNISLLHQDQLSSVKFRQLRKLFYVNNLNLKIQIQRKESSKLDLNFESSNLEKTRVS